MILSETDLMRHAWFQGITILFMFKKILFIEKELITSNTYRKALNPSAAPQASFKLKCMHLTPYFSSK